MPDGPSQESHESDETREIDAPETVARAAETQHLEVTTSRLRPMYIALFFCAVAAGGFLIGIGVAAASRSTVKTDTSTLVSSRRVGPSGAVIRFDGGSLVIPEGALPSARRITIRRAVWRDRVRVVPAEGAEQVYNPGRLYAYTFGPSSVSFLKDAQIVFRLPPGGRNGTVFARHDDTIVMLGGTVDRDRQTTTINVRNFRFAAGSPS